MKVVSLTLSLLLSGLLLVTVLISSVIASSFVVSLPSTFDGFAQIEVLDFNGITMLGQTLSVDAVFPPWDAELAGTGPVMFEIILQTGPHSGSDGDYPYNQYVVFANRTSGYFLDENGSVLNVPMADGNGGTMSAPAPVSAVISTPRGWAGADLVGYPSKGTRVGGVHYDIALPNTGETLYLGRVSVRLHGTGRWEDETEAPFVPAVPPSPTTIVWAVPSVTWEPPPVVVEPPPAVQPQPTVVWAPPPPVVEQSPAVVEPAPVVEQPPPPVVWTPPPPVVEQPPAVVEPPPPVIQEPLIVWKVSSQPAGTSVMPFRFDNLGGVSRTTDGTGAMSMGYARLHVDGDGSVPSALSVVKYRQNDTLVSETVVPDSPLLSSGRIYAEVNADVNTSIAIVNPSPQVVTMYFQLTNSDGSVVKFDKFDVPPGRFSSFIDQYPFSWGPEARGTVTLISAAPVSVSALRVLYNERTPREPLTSVLPVVDLGMSMREGTQILPYFAVGNGMSTQIVLVNPTSAFLWGSIQFTAPSGNPMQVAINGESGNTTAYFVAPNSSTRYVVTGLSENMESGTVWVLPAWGAAGPTPLGILSYKPGPFTVSEASVLPTTGTAFRMYAELATAPTTATGVAIANATGVASNVYLSLTGFDGAPLATTGPFTLSSNGQLRLFLNDVFPQLAGATLKGVLRVTSDVSAISVVGLRGRVNDRQPVPDMLVGTIPATSESSLSAGDRFFPQFVNGQGFTTEVILFNGAAGQSTEGNLYFLSPDGGAMNLPLH